MPASSAKRYDALFTECSPYRDPGTPAPHPGRPGVVRGEPRLPQGNLAQDVTIDRLNSRRSLLGQLDDQLRRAEARRTWASTVASSSVPSTC